MPCYARLDRIVQNVVYGTFKSASSNYVVKTLMLPKSSGAPKDGICFPRTSSL